jgi:hypothetical protein
VERRETRKTKRTGQTFRIKEESENVVKKKREKDNIDVV